MEFDWKAAIERNAEGLDRVVLTLIMLAGIRSHRPVVETLPRHLFNRILTILRPAEFAMRRLIAMAACKLAFKLRVAPGRTAAKATVPTGTQPVPRKQTEDGMSAFPPAPAFQLFDPWRKFDATWLTAEELEKRRQADWSWARIVPAPNRPVDARGLCRRIFALRHALVELDAHAERLARWRARRGRETTRPRRLSPFRPGRPPGWKRKPRTWVETLLVELHPLAREAWDAPDTS